LTLPGATSTLLRPALYSIPMPTQTLPIDEVLGEIRQALAARDELVLEAPPGAGKTTRVPLALLDEPWRRGRILMLEPRRMAARAAAEHMAQLLGEKAGCRVGYRIRQETRVSDRTQIEVVTGGVFTRLLQDDPSLSAYSLLIFDEFHERNLDSDLGLALSLQARALLRDQDPLKILVMSATLDGASVARLLGDAPIVCSAGRMFPVAVFYTGRSGQELIPSCVDAVLGALRDNSGSLLVFLPGQREILALRDQLQTRVGPEVQLAPLYGNLTLAEQQTAINPVAPPWSRKVVLATDIAETSLTIEGVQVVVDSGQHRAPVFDPRSGLTRLQTQRISQASATQRTGRSGRLGPGVCYRLWREDETLAPFGAPEIAQADLAPVALQILAFGLNEPANLAWLTPPPPGAFDQALDLLQQLGALTRTGGVCQLTPHGSAMAEFPAHPRLGHMMLLGAELGLGREASALSAALEESGRPAHLGPDVDVWLTELLRGGRGNAWSQRARRQMEQFMPMLPKPTVENAGITTPAGLLLALAYPDRIARQRQLNQPLYQLANGRGASLNEGDLLSRQTWLAVAEVGGAAGRRDDRIFAAAALDPALFTDALSSLVGLEERVEWSDSQQRFLAERRWNLGALSWRREPITDLGGARRSQALLDYLREKGLGLLPWDPAQEQWRARVTLLRQEGCSAAGQPPWPDVSDAGLLASLDLWLAPHVGHVNKLEDLRRLDLSQALATLLPWPLPARLDEWAPTHLSVPSGSRIAIDYSQQPPVLAVKLQEMFGCETTPRVAQGRVALMIHLLSPAQRPLQITQDLAGFWRSSYHEVKKEMKGRYPRHPWPDDPLEAVATRFTKNRQNRGD
jgi:ATP-dependent helicase HrpB